jgi:hypothetical protein
MSYPYIVQDCIEFTPDRVCVGSGPGTLHSGEYFVVLSNRPLRTRTLSFTPCANPDIEAFSQLICQPTMDIPICGISGKDLFDRQRSISI